MPVAMVTGASRGIGAAVAVALAEAGYDVAITARTVREGEGRWELTSGDAPGGRLAGSLERTAAAITAAGRRALSVPMDLLQRDTVTAAADTVIDTWGRIDVLVNNAIYKGPGSSDPFLGTPLADIERTIEGDVIAQIALLQRVIPHMLERGGGTVVNMTSHIAGRNPPGPIGEGGWAFAYAVAKGGFDRIAGMLAAELGPRGIATWNVEPGFVVDADRLEFQRRRYPDLTITPPAHIGAAVVWLLSAGEEADYLRGKRINLPTVHSRHVAPVEAAG